MKLTAQTVRQITGVEIDEELAKMLIAAVDEEISTYCNHDFIPAPTKAVPAPNEPEYPSNLCLTAAKRVTKLFNKCSQINKKKIKSKQIGSEKVEYFESDKSGKTDYFYSILNKYRIPPL